MQPVDILFVHGTVITMDKQHRIIEDGSVAVTGNQIIDIGKTAHLLEVYNPTEVIDCKHKVILPGLVDAHGHGGHCMFKHIASDTPSFWVKVMTQTYQHGVTNEFWYIEGRLSALDRIKAGITTGLSVIGSQPRSDDPVFAGNHARAYAELGAREIVAVGPCNPPWPHQFSYWRDEKKETHFVSFDEAMAGTEMVIKNWHHAANDRIRVYVTPFVIVPSLDTSTPTTPDKAIALTKFDREQSRRVRDLATKYKTRIHSDAFGGMIHLAAQDEFGLLGSDVSLQHCNGISLEEVEILGKTDTRVGHMPGPIHAIHRCPVPELMYAGVTVALVTDGTSPNRPFDLFQVARRGQLVQQMMMRDQYYLPAGKLLEMITIDAARVIGMEKEIGSLEIGKKADVITVNMRQSHLVPEWMPVHRLIHAAVGSDVNDVMVDGKVIMRDRAILTASEEEIITQAQEEATATIRRAGLEKHMQLPEDFWGKPRISFDTLRWENEP